jgi:hypothetical protein
MKNRGLLTRPTISPLGTHKDPKPVELPNQRVENVPTDWTPNDLAGTDQTPPLQDPGMQDADRPSRPKSQPIPKVTARRSGPKTGSGPSPTPRRIARKIWPFVKPSGQTSHGPRVPFTSGGHSSERR